MAQNETPIMAVRQMKDGGKKTNRTDLCIWSVCWLRGAMQRNRNETMCSAPIDHISLK